MRFSINDYVSSNEKVLWSGVNIYNPIEPSKVIVTNKKIICCDNKKIQVIPLSAVSLVECDEKTCVRICAAGGGTHGSALMMLCFNNSEAVCKQFLQILLGQIG